MSRIETTVVGNATTHVGAAALSLNSLRATGGVVTQMRTDNLSLTPTLAEITTAFGTPASAGAGFVGTIDDNGAGTSVFLCVSDGTNWHHLKMTKAV